MVAGQNDSNFLEIYPGLGLKGLEFGLMPCEVKSRLGNPDQVEIETFGDESNLIFEYHRRRLTLVFNNTEMDKLTTISIESTDTLFDNEHIFHISKENLLKKMSLLCSEIPDRERFSISSDELNECYDFDSLGLIIWFENDKLTRIDCSCLYEPNGEDIIWPNLDAG